MSDFFIQRWKWWSRQKQRKCDNSVHKLKLRLEEIQQTESVRDIFDSKLTIYDFFKLVWDY